MGHDLQHDFCALGFSHPMRLVRDTARGLPRVLGTQSGKPRKLRHLAAEMLGMEVRHSGPCPSIPSRVHSEPQITLGLGRGTFKKDMSDRDVLVEDP